MRTFKSENDFNAHLTSSIKKLGTSYKAIKTSDRFKIGMADFLIFHKGMCCAVESKYISKIPSKGNMLKHVVSGPQLSFLKGMELAGARTHIILGIGSHGGMAVFNPDRFETGNMTVKDFKECVHVYPAFHHSFMFDDIEGMLKFLFGEDPL